MRKITKWEDCEREDLNMIPTMIKNGFTPDFSYRDRMHKRTSIEHIPSDAVGFVKGNLHVWKIYNYSKTELKTPASMGYNWMTSELIDGYYTNHKPIEELKKLFK